MTSPYTPEDAREALKKILNLKNTDNTSYDNSGTTSEGESTSVITQTPDDILDSAIGVRYGLLRSIDPNQSDGFFYKVYFPESNTSVQCKLSGIYAISSVPEGTMKDDGIFYVTGDEDVSIKQIKDTLQWEIIGSKDIKLLLESKTTAIQPGDTIFKVDNDWAYINDKRICVEPCGNNDPCPPCPPIPPSGDLTITKTVDNPTPMVGETVTFVIKVTNNGPDKMTGVIARDRFHVAPGPGPM
jgi:hypothetical protein